MNSDQLVSISVRSKDKMLSVKILKISVIKTMRNNDQLKNKQFNFLVLNLIHVHVCLVFSFLKFRSNARAYDT